MSNVMMFDRSMMMGSMSGSSMPTGMTPGAMPTMSQMCMVPRCEIKLEKCPGGMKMTCICDDEMSAATLQNMCKMLCDGMCSCCCMMNGMMMCQHNLMMGMCKCTDCPDGVCITCTSGDKDCCAMIQACCDCMMTCMEHGCMCCVSMGGTPVCCGCC